MRGSDPDAALHYLARLLEAGDLPSACRRLMVCACEDVHSAVIAASVSKIFFIIINLSMIQI